MAVIVDADTVVYPRAVTKVDLDILLARVLLHLLVMLRHTAIAPFAMLTS